MSGCECKPGRAQPSIVKERSRMRHPILTAVAATVATALLILPLSAHHEITAKFDPTKTMKLSKVVTNVDWANPHVHIFMNVGTGNNMVNWAVELESVVDLQAAKFSRDTVKPGDTISACKSTTL